MNNAIKALSAAALLVSSGCAGLNKMMAEQAKRNAEANKAALIESRLKQNLPDTVKAPGVGPVVIAATNMMTANGFSCKETNDRTGADGMGMGLGCEKKKQTDLGTSVGLNVLGNMLGADRGTIVKSENEEVLLWIRATWASDGMTKVPNSVGIAIAGSSYKINQRNERVQSTELTYAKRAEFMDHLKKQFP